MTVDLVCLGNPLLDLQADVEPEYLEKNGLKQDDAILVEPNQMHIFPEVLARPDVHLLAGGAAQNTARGAAYVLGPNRVVYFGSVGRDQYSEKLLEANAKAGVKSQYMFQEDIGTGKCAAMIVGKYRSLATDLGAANHYKLEHLKAPEQWSAVEEARAFYIGGYHFTVCPDAISELGKHAAATNKPFTINLSAPFIPTAFKDALDSTQQYWDFLIGNEEEAKAYAQGHDLKTEDIETVAKHIALLPKLNTKRPRVVVITQGLDDTIVVTSGGDGKSTTTKRYPVSPLDQSSVKDTNGAGDAFAGGFVAGLVEGKDVDTSVAMGQWLARESLQLIGPSFPAERKAFKASD